MKVFSFYGQSKLVDKRSGLYLAVKIEAASNPAYFCVLFEP